MTLNTAIDCQTVGMSGDSLLNLDSVDFSYNMIFFLPMFFFMWGRFFDYWFYVMVIKTCLLRTQLGLKIHNIYDRRSMEGFVNLSGSDLIKLEYKDIANSPKAAQR
ncbi:hypothetical protein ACJX0J_010475 [Zea mays]